MHGLVQDSYVFGLPFVIFSLRGIFKLSTCTRELSLLFDKSRRSIHYLRIRGARERGIFLSLGSFHLTPASTFHTILCFATFNNSLNFMFRCFPFHSTLCFARPNIPFHYEFRSIQHSIPVYVLLDSTFHSVLFFAPVSISIFIQQQKLIES